MPHNSLLIATENQRTCPNIFSMAKESYTMPKVKMQKVVFGMYLIARDDVMYTLSVE